MKPCFVIAFIGLSFLLLTPTASQAQISERFCSCERCYQNPNDFCRARPEEGGGSGTCYQYYYIFCDPSYRTTEALTDSRGNQCSEATALPTSPIVFESLALEEPPSVEIRKADAD